MWTIHTAEYPYTLLWGTCTYLVLVTGGRYASKSGPAAAVFTSCLKNAHNQWTGGCLVDHM